jgi:hypothetical protein
MSLNIYKPVFIIESGLLDNSDCILEGFETELDSIEVIPQINLKALNKRENFF